jgi:phage gp46-like protein
MAITTRVVADPQAIPAPDIIWDGVRGDFALVSAAGQGPRGGLRGGQAFATAVCLLLFTDAQIDDSELTIFMQGDKRGWAGDGFDIDATAGETALGSKLWLYRRAELVAETGRAIEDETRRVLQTLLDQKACARIDVAATVDAPNGRVALQIDIYGDDGARVFAQKFDDLWQAMTAPGPLLSP